MAAPPDITVIPLEEYDSVYCVNYTVNGGVMYRAIVDSGSPFLIVPTVCTRQWGCAPKHPPFALAGYPPTIEVFGGQNYDSEWKVGFLRFPLAKAPYRVPPTPVVFAAVGYQVMLPPGGVFLGLIKDRCGDIRPTLMEQLQYNAFRFDAKNNELTLSRRPLIPPEVDAIRLLDLRPLGDPVYHYAARVKSLQINGVEIGMGTTIFAVFDTGCTGCVLSEDLVTDERTPGPPRRVRVVLETQSGGEQVVETFATKKRMFVVTSSRIPWFRLDSLEKDTTGSTAAGATARVAYASSVAAGGAVSRIGDVVVDSSGRIDTKNVKMLSDTATSFAQVVVIGLTFLRDKVLTIDIDDKRLTLGDT